MRRALVIGIGGGGDAVSALVIKSYYEKLGYETVLGAVMWERFVVDPVPGPICAEDLINFVPFASSIYWVNERTEALRGEKPFIVRPQLSNVLSAIKERGVGICIRDAPETLAKELRDFVNDLKVDVVIGVDAGGDVLAKGCEPGLSSPLIDFTMLSTLTKLEKEVNTLLAVMGLGSDGELEVGYLLKRVAEIASRDGLVDIKGYDLESYNTVSKALEYVETEASRIPWMAFKGLFGDYQLRGGLRKVEVSPLTSIAFLMRPGVVAQTSPLYHAIDGARTLEEMRAKMNEVGVFTEYDLEMELYKLTNHGKKRASYADADTVRKEARKRLGAVRLPC
jgi:hypothetical protein